MKIEELSMGEAIANLRKQNSLSQDDLAEKLNVSRQAVSSWERNVTCPDLLIIKQLSQLFDLTIDDIVKGNIKPKVKNVYKYDMAIGLFYSVALFLSLGLFLVIGLSFNQERMWLISGIGCLFLFFVLGISAHAIITLARKDRK